MPMFWEPGESQIERHELLDQIESQIIEHRRNVVLVGAAGSGKSTLLHTLSARLAEDGHIPVSLNLRDTVRTSDLEIAIARRLLVALSEWLRSQRVINRPEILAQINDMLSNTYGKRLAGLYPIVDLAAASTEKGTFAVILADGLDELAEPTEVAQWLTRFANAVPAYIKLVISSRVSRHTELFHRYRGFTHIVLRGITQQESIEYLRKQLSEVSMSDAVITLLAEQAQGIPGVLAAAAQFAREYGDDVISFPRYGQVIRRLYDSALQGPEGDVSWRLDTIKVLRNVALFRPVSVTFLAESSGISVERVLEIVNRPSILKFIPDGSIEFVHRIFSDYVTETLIVPPDLDVSDLEFGDEAAERDTRLVNAFIPRPDVTQILEGKKSIVLGDRGAGKSAIFRLLQSQTSAHPMGVGAYSAGYTPLLVTSQNPSEFFQQFTADDPGISNPERFKAMWLLHAAALAASEIQSIVLEPSKASRQYLDQAHRLLRSSGHADRIVGGTKTAKLWASLRSTLSAKVTFSVGPVKIEPNVSSKPSRFGLGSRFSVNAFVERIDQLLNSRCRMLLIVFDQIDETYKYQRDLQEALVQGLFLAEAFFAQTTSVRMVILLRTDLFEIYDIQEKNKFVSRLVRLEWSRAELLDLLLERLFSNPALSSTKAFLWTDSITRETRHAVALKIAFPEEVEGMFFVEWLWSGLRNGNNRISPRQIILFLNLARDAAVRAQSRTLVPIFSVTSVMDAMTTLSKLSYEEVVSDFRVATTFVRNCRAGKLLEFDGASVQHLFAIEDGPIPQQVERLERLGFLERGVLRDAEGMLYKFRIPLLYTRWWDQNIP